MDTTFDQTLINKWLSEAIFLEEITQAIFNDNVQISVSLIGADDDENAAFVEIINQKIHELAEIENIGNMEPMEGMVNG